MTKNKPKPNAQHGDEPKSSYLHMRVTREQKARWVKQAQARGMKLSAWVCERLDESPAAQRSGVMMGGELLK